MFLLRKSTSLIDFGLNKEHLLLTRKPAFENILSEVTEVDGILKYLWILNCLTSNLWLFIHNFMINSMFAKLKFKFTQ